MGSRSTHVVRILLALLLGVVPAACANDVTCDEPAEVDDDGAPAAEPEPRAEPEPESPGPEDDTCSTLYVDTCCDVEGCGQSHGLGCVGEIRDCFLHRELCRSDEVCLVDRVSGDRGCSMNYDIGYVGVCARRDEL